VEPARSRLEASQSALNEVRQRVASALSGKQRDNSKADEASRLKLTQAISGPTSEATRLRSDLANLAGSIRNHLSVQGVSIAEESDTERSASGVATASAPALPPTPAELLPTASQLVAEIRDIAAAAQRTKKPTLPFWPDNNKIGLWTVGIAFLLTTCIGNNLLFFIAFLAIFAGVMLCVNHFSTVKLSSFGRGLLMREAKANLLLDQYVESVASRARAEDTSGRERRAQEYSALKARLQQEVEAAEWRFKEETAETEKRLRPTIMALRQAIAEFSEDTRFVSAGWESSTWTSWSPSSAPQLAVRFGLLSAETNDLKKHFRSLDWAFELPALAPFTADKCLLFDPPTGDMDSIRGAVQGIVTRLLATNPSGKVLFTFIDPVGLGNNVRAFMPLADHEELLVTSRAWSEPQHVEQRLANLTEHMETVIQKYLRDEYRTIHEYNIAAGEVAEAYRFLVVFDFPVNFSDTAARRLVSIARNGPRCGVYAVIVCAKGKPDPYGFHRSDFGDACSVVGDSHAVEVPELQSESIKAAATSETSKRPTVGRIYLGRVVSVKEFGAFVEVQPGQDGLVHISELAPTRVRRTEDVANVGDSMWVKCIAIDDKGRVKLSRKAAIHDRAANDPGNEFEGEGPLRPGEEDGHSIESKPSRSHAGGGLRWHDKDFSSWKLLLDLAPPRDLVTAIITKIGGTAREAMRVEVPYAKLLLLAELNDDSWWKGTTVKSIRVPLGQTGARKSQYLTLGEGMAHHALIVGRPGSGKSNLMHVIITSLALTYSPDEMRIYLIDFKRGVEFKSYADHRLPHAEAIAIDSEREFGLSVVERLDAELKARGHLFTAAGAADITEYRHKTKAQIPRVLLIVDEFQEFFTQDDYIARQVTLILDRLVRQGRGFGIHIMLGSQTLAGSYNLPKSTLDLMAIRIAMQCSEADSRLVLADDNPAARLLSRPGEAIYNAASGLVEGNNLFQVARFSDEDREERLDLVIAIAQRSDKPVRVPIVFEGNELARLEDCRSLHDLLTAPSWPSNKGMQLLLGDPIAIRGPIAARVRRQSGNNLLILSRDEAEGVGMCVASILSVLAQQPPGTVKIVIADFTLADSDWAERAEEIEEFFPHDVKVLGKQRAVADAVKEVSDEVKRRIDAPPETSSLFLVLQGLQRMKVLRTEEDSFRYDDDSTTPAELLAYVLREGPETGVHVIAWCDTYPNAARVADRRTMNEFGLRAGGVMSADDSMSFFDDAAASRIDKPHRVLFFDEERPGQLEKFRPYSMPPREWLKTTGAQMSARAKT
jgi:predicted RNA-binding protein with RPS1 domain